MPSRRQVLSTGTAAAAWGLTGPWHAAASAIPTPAFPARPDLVLVDDRFAEARAFAAGLSDMGVTSIATQGDIGRLWHESVRHEAARNRLRIAGMARPAEFFVLETLAREAGLRLIYTGRHEGRCRQQQKHTVRLASDPAFLIQACRRDSWPHALAAALTRVPRDTGPMQAAETVQNMPARVDHPGVLVSWLLA